jgi:hypothetical protein
MLIAVPVVGQARHFIPTSQEVAVATMAARDEGYDLNRSNVYLNEIHTQDGQEQNPRYMTIGLYQDDHLVREYAIRIDTGDVVDPMKCEILQYPNLLKFKRARMRDLRTQEASLNLMAAEVACVKLRPIGKKSSK